MCKLFFFVALPYVLDDSHLLDWTGLDKAYNDTARSLSIFLQVSRFWNFTETRPRVVDSGFDARGTLGGFLFPANFQTHASRLTTKPCVCLSFLDPQVVLEELIWNSS
jgi:hypothetical protein